MKKIMKIVPLSLLFSTGVFLSSTASAEGVTGGAEIELHQADEQPGVLDPETMTPADPGVIANTEGRLRIDFAPQLMFSTGLLSDKDATYLAHAQLFKDQTNPRGNFVQVSDYRDVKSGWTLQVRQENQFQHTEHPEIQLNGAVISFDKAWTNNYQQASSGPKVSKEVIQMTNVGETYTLAEAEFEQGGGTWSIAFGASAENPSQQTNTLEPLKDSKGEPVIDSEYNQAIFTNNAVKLTIPGATKKVTGTYSTVLTWIIAELP